MVELSAQQQLALLFPKSNRAIIETLAKASPEQLEKLSQAKDIKSLINSLMRDTLDVSKSNTIILDILKNSAFFKELGNFSKDMKTLVQLLQETLLKQDDKASHDKLDKTTKALASALLNFTDKDSSGLKEFIKNSGVFLESKLSQEINPKQELRVSLEALQTKLSQSELPLAKGLIKDISNLLQNTSVFSKTADVTSLSALKIDLDKILTQLKDIQRFTDPIHAKNVEKFVESLEKFQQTATTKTENISLSQLKDLIGELSSELRVSTQDSTKLLLTGLDNISNKLKGIEQKNQTQALMKSMLKELETIEVKNLTQSELKDLNTNIEKLKLISQMQVQDLESLSADEFKNFVTNFSSTLSATKADSIMQILEKILSSLKQPLINFEQQKIPQDIKTWLNDFHKEVSKGDIIFSKSMQETLSKIELFAKPAHLLNNNLLQESLQKDVKALLLGLEKELSGTGNTEVLKAVDKLLVQIDYFQLVSHLSNASYLYIPYAWEQLEDGSLSFKKSKDGSCYCEIDLELSEYGKLNMMMQLFEDNQLNITIYTQKKELKALFKENMKDLRSALVGVNVMPRNIHLHDLDETQKQLNPYESQEKLNELGFEAKG